METVKFRLTEEHIKLMKRLNFVLSDGMEGVMCPLIDAKRPFGNGDVIADVLRVIGEDATDITEEKERRARDLLAEMPVALEIVMRQQTFTPGEYEVDKYGAWFETNRYFSRRAEAIERINREIEKKTREVTRLKMEKEALEAEMR